MAKQKRKLSKKKETARPPRVAAPPAEILPAPRPTDLSGVLFDLVDRSMHSAWSLPKHNVEAVISDAMSVLDDAEAKPVQKMMARQSLIECQKIAERGLDRTVKIIECGLLQQIAQSTKKHDVLVDDAELAEGIARLMGTNEGAA